MIAVASLLFAAILAGSTQGAERRVHFVIGCSGSVYQPPKIALTCADGKVVFYADDGWEAWGSTSASTRGTLAYPDCPPRVPLVACRNYAENEAVIHLWRPVYCKNVGHWQFTRLRVVDLEGAGPIGFDGPSRYTCSSFGSEPKRFLGRAAAKRYMRAVLSRPRLAYDHRAGGSINCRKRLSRTRVACRMRWVVGDGGFFGRGQIWLTFRRQEKQAHFSYRLTSVDEYCLDVTPERDCTRRLRDSGRVPTYLLNAATLPQLRLDSAPRPTATSSAVCPNPADLERPASPRGAIPGRKGDRRITDPGS